jgi:hypothetical protein
MLISAPPALLLQAPVAANVTAPVPLPPEVLTVKLVPFAALAGAPLTVSVACGALVAVTGAAAEVASSYWSSAALVATIEHVPVPLDIVISAPPFALLHTPDAWNVTAPEPLPPDVPTVKLVS